MYPSRIKFNVKTVFVDIDDTLTSLKPGSSDNHDDPLAVLVAKKNGIPLDAAERLKRKAEESVTEMTGGLWPFGILDQLNISEDELWEAYKADGEERLFMHTDAAAFLKGLREHYPEWKIYTATTNPQLIIYSKLAIAGFAERSGSPYLDGAFGGEEIYPGGKTSPEFFTALLKKTGSDAETTLMVGDSLEMDLALAKAAGINQVALPRRNQKEDWVWETAGGLYLKRLDLIFNFIS